ncbi:MAG: hypothetical protein U0587_14810 [Candidatus Binatia bacterium]
MGRPLAALGPLTSIAMGCGDGIVIIAFDSDTTYYLYDDTTWFKPSFGANGAYYRVVPAP